MEARTSTENSKSEVATGGTIMAKCTCIFVQGRHFSVWGRGRSVGIIVGDHNDVIIKLTNKSMRRIILSIWIVKVVLCIRALDWHVKEH